MSSKFASVTSTLLVRKGNAAPSKVRRGRLPQVVVSDDETKEMDKLVLTLSAKESEVLNKLAAKKERRAMLSRAALWTPISSGS